MSDKKLDSIQLNLIREVAGLHKVPEGAYSLRVDGQMYGKNSSENIIIEKKTDKPGIDIYIKEGQLLSIDCGLILNGWQSDAARTFCIGEVSQLKKKLVKVTEECFFKAVANLKDGSPIGDIGYYVQTHAEQNGFSVVRALTGHGIGTEMHESPSIPNFGRKGTGIRLKKGMALAIEPMINAGDYKVDFMPDGWGVKTKDRLPSAHYENTVVITDEGAEILTL